MSFDRCGVCSSLPDPITFINFIDVVDVVYRACFGIVWFNLILLRLVCERVAFLYIQYVVLAGIDV